MKSSYRDHLKSKFKPTLFGLFENQDDSLLSNVYAYIYKEKIWSSGFISTCNGPVHGSYMDVTFSAVTGEFDAYSVEVQQKVLARVNNYLADFDSATRFKPSQEEYNRLVEVLNYFKDHIKIQPTETNQKSLSN